MFMSVSSTRPTNLNGDLVHGPPRRQKAEDRIGARGNGDRDCEHVVHEKRGAGEHAPVLPKELRRHNVSAAAGRKVLDDAGVRVADDEDRQRCRQREKNSEARVLPELLEGLFRTVRAGRQAVRSEADPCEERNERQLMKGVGIFHVLRGPEDRAP